MLTSKLKSSGLILCVVLFISPLANAQTQCGHFFSEKTEWAELRLAKILGLDLVSMIIETQNGKTSTDKAIFDYLVEPSNLSGERVLNSIDQMSFTLEAGLRATPVQMIRDVLRNYSESQNIELIISRRAQVLSALGESRISDR